MDHIHIFLNPYSRH